MKNFLLLFLAISVYAQRPQPTGPTANAGRFTASIYGSYSLLSMNNVAAGSQVMSLNQCYPNLGTNVQNNFFPISLTTPLNLIDGPNSENVTPTQINSPRPTQYGDLTIGPYACSFVATFTKPHLKNIVITSATGGLQEAINDAHGKGGGIAVIDSSWSGQTSIITTTLQGFSNVNVEDTRTGEQMYAWDGTKYAAIGTGGGSGGCIATAATLSSKCGVVVGTLATITDGLSATDCTVGGGSTIVACQYNGSIWTATAPSQLPAGVAKGSQLVSNGVNQSTVYQTKAVYDVRDWATCDTPVGTSSGTDATLGINVLLATIGSAPATIQVIGKNNPADSCLVSTINWGANITLDFSGGGSLTLINSLTPTGNMHVDGSAVGAFNSSTTSCSVTLNVPNGGDGIFVGATVHFASNGGTLTPTDNQGNVYRLISTANADTNHYSTNTMGWLASNVPAGSTTITIPIKAATNNACGAFAIIGGGPSLGVDGGTGAQCANSCATSNPMTTVGSATYTAGSMVVGFGGQTSTTETCTPMGGFTQLLDVGTNMNFCLQEQDASAGGATTVTSAINNTPTGSVWMYNSSGIKPIYAVNTILGGLVNPNLHQIFYGASTAGQAQIDFTGNLVQDAVYPEWWGASPSATAAVNTPALQAAEHGAFGTARTNPSGLYIYNKALNLSGNYSINAELQFYDVINFKVRCDRRLSGGITQTVANLRIIDAQSIAYGAFDDCIWTGGASSTNALIDIDKDGITTPNDLAPQFIDFNRNFFNGNNQVDTGVLIAKSGGAAQGSNIYCWNCEGESFTGAVWQIGGDGTGRNVGRGNAQNAIDVGWYGGDMQGNLLYGFASYGGGHLFLRDVTMENGFSTQTGFDMFCAQQVGSEPCIMDNVRSESRRLISSSLFDVRNSYTVDQSSLPTPGTSDPVGTIKKGSKIAGDGQYYKVTTDTPSYPGAGSPTATLRASGGSGTTLTDTNETVAGSVTIGTPTTTGEALTQDTSGATATLLNVPASTGTITGSVTTGTIGSGHTMTQGTTGVTCISTNAPTGSASLTCRAFSGTADNSHAWTDGTTSGTYTPSAAPTFSVSSPVMLITLASGSPDSTHDWVGGTSGFHYTPTGAPVAEANWSTNAFTGLAVAVGDSSASSTNVGCYGVITSNTSQTVTFSGGWLNKYSGLTCGTPDTTSRFWIECYLNGGGVINCGSMVLTALNEKGIDGSNGGVGGIGTLENVAMPGDQILVGSQAILRNVTVTRPDWLPAVSNGWWLPQLDHDWDVHLIQTVASGGTSVYQNWKYTGTTGSSGVPLNAPFQRDWGSTPLVWSCGSGFSNVCAPTWIGGRSDSNALNSVSRNVLEYGGILGRPSPFGTDQNGTATQIQGGLPTGAGTPGNIEFWTAPGGGTTGTTAQSGALVASVTPTGVSTTGQFTSTLASGTAPLVITSTTPVAHLTTVPTTYNLGGTQQTAVHIVRDHCTLGTSCSVTLTGSAVFTSSSSYECSGTDETAAAAVKFAPSSGSAFALTGTGTDVISFICVGN